MKKKNYIVIYPYIGTVTFQVGINSSFSKCKFLNQQLKLKIFLSTNRINSTIKIPLEITLNIIPEPNRMNRILVDNFYHLQYPFDGLIMKDNLFDNIYNFDWNSDSISTNFRGLFDYLTSEDFFVEESKVSISQLDLSLYAVFILIDSEKECSESDVTKLRDDFEKRNVGLFIISEWNNDYIKNIIKDTKTVKV